MRRVFVSAILGVALVSATAAAATAAPKPQLVTVPVAVQSSLSIPALQGGQGDVLAGFQGTLTVAQFGPQLGVVVGGQLTAKGASGAVYSAADAVGVVTPFGALLAFTLRVTTPSAAEQKLLDSVKQSRALADLSLESAHEHDVKALEADQAKDEAAAAAERAAAQQARDTAAHLIADAEKAEAQAARLEAPTTPCIRTSATMSSASTC
ncbi:MAG: hypothetical protein QOF43_281 [Gaiellaceae bacterium]|nr:hypothetical protein [Gaiellaceae bacterium]